MNKQQQPSVWAAATAAVIIRAHALAFQGVPNSIWTVSVAAAAVGNLYMKKDPLQYEAIPVRMHNFWPFQSWWWAPPKIGKPFVIYYQRSAPIFRLFPAAQTSCLLFNTSTKRKKKSFCLNRCWFESSTEWAPRASQVSRNFLETLRRLFKIARERYRGAPIRYAAAEHQTHQEDEEKEEEENTCWTNITKKYNHIIVIIVILKEMALAMTNRLRSATLVRFSSSSWAVKKMFPSGPSSSMSSDRQLLLSPSSSSRVISLN